jgi:hypothetical protein
MSISAQQVSSWTRIVVSSLVLVGVFLAVGYGLIGIFLLFLLVAMGGGALLYWVDGESER